MVDDELTIAVAETTPAMLWMGDSVGRCVFLNAALRRFWGIDPKDLDQFDWLSTLHPDDAGLLSGPFTAAMERHAPFVVEARYRRADGVYRIMRTEANPRFGKDSVFVGMTGVNTDVTEQRDAEQQSRYLMGELNHRTKNLIAVVMAIARATARSTEPEAFLDVFASRLSGLASSNDLLVARDWMAVSLGDLVAGQFRTISMEGDERIAFGGCDISVCPQHAQTLGMALHELATNSLKHGALAEPNGRLSVTWHALDGDHWRIEWREGLTRPVVPPERKGFGHLVMVDMVERAIHGTVNLRFEPQGVVWSLEV